VEKKVLYININIKTIQFESLYKKCTNIKCYRIGNPQKNKEYPFFIRYLIQKNQMKMIKSKNQFIQDFVKKEYIQYKYQYLWKIPNLQRIEIRERIKLKMKKKIGGYIKKMKTKKKIEFSKLHYYYSAPGNIGCLFTLDKKNICIYLHNIDEFYVFIDKHKDRNKVTPICYLKNLMVVLDSVFIGFFNEREFILHYIDSPNSNFLHSRLWIVNNIKHCKNLVLKKLKTSYLLQQKINNNIKNLKSIDFYIPRLFTGGIHLHNKTKGSLFYVI
jgi:hypothetical protein